MSAIDLKLTLRRLLQLDPDDDASTSQPQVGSLYFPHLELLPRDVQELLLELFSPDESVIAYVGRVGAEYFIVINGERRFGPYPDVSPIAFDDSGAIRFIALDGDGNFTGFVEKP